MSDFKKGRRKSKLEVRDDVDNEETEKSILQKLLQSPEPEQPSSGQHISSTSSTNFLDHTYARLHDEPTPTSSALHISVKVEVEEFDESIMNDSVSPLPVPSIPQFRDHRRKAVSAFEIDLEKMYKISEHINWSSTNLADKYLSTELKNVWGRVLKPDDDDDPYNKAIQTALNGWGHNLLHGSHKPWRESPLFYQCHICNIAWWYLSPFRDHIRIHDHRTLKINHLLNGHESNIVASYRDVNQPIYLPCEGDCYRCGNPFNFHVKPHKTIYSCKKCFQGLETCTQVRQHDLVCKDALNSRKGKNVHQCCLCLSLFFSNNALDMHMVKSHQVRSDIPTPFAFKTCNVCRKKYHYYFTHMCVKSSLSSSCTCCYRKFQTKLLQQAHCQIGNGEDYKCKICDVVLTMKCMETEHMLKHTNNYCMAYKCINYACPPIILFPDEQAVKLHKVLYHFQKHDKRRSYFEKVLIPQQCVKLDYEQIINCLGEAGGIKLRKVPEFHIPEGMDWCVPSSSEHTVQHAQNDDLFIIKQELNEPIVIDCHDNSEDDSQDNSQEHIQEGAMDYAEMLSKVFKMADVERTPRRASGKQIHTKIKLEPLDVDYENLIEIKEHPVSIKREPIDARPGKSYQTDSCQNDSRIDSCQSDTRIDSFETSHSQNDFCQSEISRTDSCETNGSQGDICETDTSRYDSCQNNTSPTETGSIQGGITVKTEPQDFEIDTVFETDFTAVKMEPEDVKQEFLEFTELNEYADSDVITAEASPATPETTNTKTVKKNPNSLLKSTQEEEIVASQHSKSLLKPNVAKDKSTPKTRPQKTKTSPKRSPKSILKRNLTDDTSDSPKAKIPKYDENGLKIRKLYTCTKCGYTESHKLFRLHQKSFCDLDQHDTPQKNNKYTCTKCDTCFGSLKSYLVHFTMHGYGALHCPCCNMKFETMKDLLPHFHKHVKMNYVNCWMINEKLETTKKQNRCQMCRQTVPPESFFSHWEGHLKVKMEKVEPMELKISDERITVSHKQALQPATLHLALHQLRSMSRDKDCDVCCRKFTRRYDVKRHLIEHLLLDAYTKKDKTHTMLLRCQICLEEFPRAEQYKFHMREHGSLPVYRCELCDKTFSDSSNFAKHKKIHNMRVLICDICQKKFHAKFSLEKHIKMHMTTDPIKCDLCDRKFYATSQYNKHLHVRHMGPMKFRCVVCDITFDSLRKKWDHAWAVHKERKQKADCPICHTKFRKYQDVKNHAKEEHQVELSFFNIKSDTGVVNNVNTICKIKKTRKKPSIVSKHPRKEDK